VNFFITVGQTANANGGLGGGIGVALQNGSANCMLYGPTNNAQGLNYYGYFDSGANGGIIPAIYIDYSSGGISDASDGSDGEVIITYTASSQPVYTLSVSATQATDIFGNTVQPGFQGPQVTVVGTQAPSTTPTGSTVAASAVVTSSTTGTVIATNTASFTGMMPTNQVDVTKFTVTLTSLQPLTKAYSIPAGDPQVGTIYRLTAWGDIAIGANVTQMTWSMVGWGATLATATWGTTQQSVSTTYEWMVTGIAQISATSGSVRTWLTGTIGLFGQNLGNAQYGGALTGAFGDTSIPATSGGNTLGFQGHLGGAASGYVPHGDGSILERLGP
jgi:hypothetical protein